MSAELINLQEKYVEQRKRMTPLQKLVITEVNGLTGAL